jgi:hypothetical protein
MQSCGFSGGFPLDIPETPPDTMSGSTVPYRQVPATRQVNRVTSGRIAAHGRGRHIPTGRRGGKAANRRLNPCA